MNFREIAEARYSCRHYDSTRPVEEEKLQAILEAAMLAPSACNSQPYHITVCRGEVARAVGRSTRDANINVFAEEAPVLLVISERPYNARAERGSCLKQNDYRSIDIGILSAYITAEATARGLATCIIGWLESDEIVRLAALPEGKVRLVITLGYAKDEPRPKHRKPQEEMISYR